MTDYKNASGGGSMKLGANFRTYRVRGENARRTLITNFKKLGDNADSEYSGIYELEGAADLLVGNVCGATVSLRHMVGSYVNSRVKFLIPPRAISDLSLAVERFQEIVGVTLPKPEKRSPRRTA